MKDETPQKNRRYRFSSLEYKRYFDVYHSFLCMYGNREVGYEWEQ